MKMLKAKTKPKVVIRFSRINAIIFAVVFAGVGAYIISRSFALTNGCTTTVNTSSGISSAANSALPGDVICVAAGNYAGPNITASKTGDITIQPASGATVTFTSEFSISDGAKHIVVQHFIMPHGMTISALSGNAPSYITVAYNDITTDSLDGYALILDSYDCAIQGCGSGSVPWIDYTKIIGNRFHDVGINNNHSQDDLELKHSRHTEVAYNEFESTIFDPSFYLPNGDQVHVDNIVIISGGSDVNVHHNYFHDNNAQNFFVKDGHADNVTFSQNLLLRNDAAPASGNNSVNVYDITNFIADHNTVWPNKAFVTQGSQASQLSLTNNTIQTFSNLGSGWTVSQQNNIIGGNPVFVDPAHDDYRLANNPNGIGITWSPADFVYGPGNGGSASGGGGGSTKIGDFNGDGYVNGFDLNIFFQAWKSTAKPPQDFNQDGSVNGYDLAIFLAQL